MFRSEIIEKYGKFLKVNAVGRSKKRYVDLGYEEFEGCYVVEINDVADSCTAKFFDGERFCDVIKAAKRDYLAEIEDLKATICILERELNYI